VDAATSPPPLTFTDVASAYNNDIGSYQQYVMKMLSSEMLPEKEIESTTAFAPELTEVHSPVSDSSSNLREPNTGWLVSDQHSTAQMGFVR